MIFLRNSNTPETQTTSHSVSTSCAAWLVRKACFELAARNTSTAQLLRRQAKPIMNPLAERPVQDEARPMLNSADEAGESITTVRSVPLHVRRHLTALAPQQEHHGPLMGILSRSATSHRLASPSLCMARSLVTTTLNDGRMAGFCAPQRGASALMHHAPLQSWRDWDWEEDGFMLHGLCQLRLRVLGTIMQALSIANTVSAHLVPAVCDQGPDFLRPVRRERLPETCRHLLRIVEHCLAVVTLTYMPIGISEVRQRVSV